MSRRRPRYLMEAAEHRRSRGERHMIGTEWSFGSVLWLTVVLMFWTMVIWIFITLFADIFRRDDIGGWAKAGWILLIFVVPFLGALIYMIARPKMTEQDRRMMDEAAEAQRRLS